MIGCLLGIDQMAVILLEIEGERALVLHSWSRRAAGSAGDIRQATPSQIHVRTRLPVLPHRNGGPVLYHVLHRNW